MGIRAVVFDLGETLADETRLYGLWADWFGIPRLTFFAALGAVIERGESHRRVFELFRPGVDLAQEAEARGAAGWPADVLGPEDLYADALPCLAELRRRGYWVGVAGNQPAAVEAAFARARLPVDAFGTSASWGVRKPERGFFARVVAEAGVRPEEVAYVGDRLDNDVLPAVASGLLGVFIRRGPWGVIHALRPEVVFAPLRVDHLFELPDALEPFRAEAGGAAGTGRPHVVDSGP